VHTLTTTSFILCRQAFLADGGISIPSDSTSFMTPLSAHKLHTELLNATDAKKQLQTPFVVMLHNVRPLAEIKKVFYFEHPNPDNGTTHGPDNSRYACVCARCAVVWLFGRAVACGLCVARWRPSARRACP